MNNRLRRIMLTMLVAIVAITMVACDGGESEATSTDAGGFRTPVPEPAELAGAVRLSTYSTASNDTSSFMFISDYILQYPGVEIEDDNDYTYEEYFATLDERVEDGSIGDVFLVDAERLARYVENGWVVDLTPYLDGLVEYTSGSYNRLYPDRLFYKSAYESALYENHMYMIPTEYENKAVLVNMTLFESVGLDVPLDSWTWNDVLDYAKKLKDNGCDTPLSLDYKDFSVWGAFAMSKGGEIFRESDSSVGTTTLNLTDPKVVTGLQFLAEEFIDAGYVADKTPAEITAEELKNYGMVVMSHSDLSRWSSALSSDEFVWEFAHFPSFTEKLDSEEGGTVSEEAAEIYRNIGVKTLGLAVRVRDNAEDAEAALMQLAVNTSLALYAMVDEAAVHIAGTTGARVPALITANVRKFWREYPVSGKNTSVFSLYHDYDYSATLTAYMRQEAANEIDVAMGEAIDTYVNAFVTGTGSNVAMDDLLQVIQNNANINW